MGKIYVVGHKGFVGKHVVELVPKEKLVLITRDVFQEIINSEKSYAFAADDILINLAWDHLDNFRSSEHISHCLPEHIKFYEKVFKMGLKKVCAIGTCLEYGVKEGELSEEIPSDPQLPYAIAKDSLRNYFEYKALEIGLKYNWIRLFYIFGENQSLRTIYGQLVKAIEDKQECFDMSPGLQKRDYLHVGEVAKIIYYIASRNEGFGIINCCSGRPITMIDFVNQRLIEHSYKMKLNHEKYTYPTYEGFEFWGSVKKLDKIRGVSSEQN